MQEHWEEQLDDGDVYDTSHGAVEFKNDDYATQQTLKEMMKTAGDLVTTVLLQGNQANKVR